MIAESNMNKGHPLSSAAAPGGMLADIPLAPGKACRAFAPEGLGVGFWEWRAPENTPRLADGWRELLGHAEACGGEAEAAWESLAHPDDLPGCLAAFERHARGETPLLQHECRLRTGDGSYRWFLARGKTLPGGADGAPPRVAGTLVDVTDRKELECALASQQSRYRAVVETVVDGIVVIDAGGAIQSLNPAAERIFGYAAQELVGHSVNRLMPEPYRGAHDHYLRRYAETGQAHIIGYGREVVGLRKNGTTFPASLAVSEMRIDGSAYFTGIVRDITTRKRSEESLLIAASVYRSIGEAVLVTDADNNIITVNEPFTALTGYELHELIGKNPKILAGGRQDRAFYEAMWNSLQTEGRWQGEIWNRRKNGQAYLESLSISIVYGDDGKPLRHVAVFSELAPG